MRLHRGCTSERPSRLGPSVAYVRPSRFGPSVRPSRRCVRRATVRRSVFADFGDEFVADERQLFVFLDFGGERFLQVAAFDLRFP